MVWGGIYGFLVAMRRFFLPNCTKPTILYDKMPNSDLAITDVYAGLAG
jgi:hypothetical protein